MEKIRYLSQINLFSELSAEDLVELERIGPMSTVKKGQIIISPDKEVQGVYLLKKGCVRLYRLNPEGKQFTGALLGHGNIFGEIETFSTGTRHVYAESLSEVILCILKKDDFEQFMLKRPKVVLKLLEVLTKRMRHSEEMMEDLALGDVKTRLGNLLLKLAEDFGIGIEHKEYTRLDAPLTHQELAHMIGTTRETVSSVLSAWAKELIVTTERKVLFVYVDKLKRHINSL